MDDQFVSIGKAAKMIGMSIDDYRNIRKVQADQVHDDQAGEALGMA